MEQKNKPHVSDKHRSIAHSALAICIWVANVSGGENTERVNTATVSWWWPQHQQLPAWGVTGIGCQSSVPLRPSPSVYSITSHETTVHWPIISRLLHFVEENAARDGWLPTQPPSHAPPDCIKCNSHSQHHTATAWARRWGLFTVTKIPTYLTNSHNGY